MLTILSHLYARRALPGVVVAACALAAPAAAGASSATAHDLKLYKVERQVSLTAPDLLTDVACDSGDYALDGMWRVDAVDQGNSLTDVRVPEAYPDAVDKARYRFHFTKSFAGQAQIKVFVTCLGSKTAIDGHQHSFTLGNRVAAPFAGGPGVGAGFQPGANACPLGQIAVAPGYQFASGGGHIVGSRASLSSESTPGRNWAMAFWLDAPSTWTTYFRCLSLTSSTAAGHHHKIKASFVGDPQVYVNVNPGRAELRTNCGEREKALVGHFDTFPWFAEQDWFLGMDPRIKQRAFSFLNAGGGPMQVWTGVTCFNDRTTKAL